MPSRRHIPSFGPARLGKSDGQFTVKNILTKAFGSSVDKFTASTCIGPESLEREHINYQDPNGNRCPAGYRFVGLGNPDKTFVATPGVGIGWGVMYNNTCVKSDYNATDFSPVASCCTGATPAKNCDPSLCVGSQPCRDKMTSFCSNPVWGYLFNQPECATYLNARGNEDVRSDILSKNCSAGNLAGGICRDFAKSGNGHGQMDSAVISWCTDKIQIPLTQEQKNIAAWTRYRHISGAPRPPVRLSDDAIWDVKMSTALAAAGGVQNPYSWNKVMYPPPEYYNNSQDPICSCILSQLNKTGEKSPPVACFDSKCQMSGYQTVGMMRVAANCPSWVECRSTVLAASSGVVDNVKINQMCGVPPDGTPSIGTGTVPPSVPYVPPTPATTGGIKDDGTLLKEDEARAAGTKPATTVINMPAAQTLSQQLNAPFAPSLFGSTSIAEVSILFFVMLILGAILYRSWMNRQAAQLIQSQYAQALEYDKAQEHADRTVAVKEAIAAMPR